ncbi:MAG: IS4 family transposase [Phycisphaerales bacterium]|nr:IS4 family transposase [Phycisphaerales bacterium]
MTRSIASIVDELKLDIGASMSAGIIEKACQLGNHQWRERTLGPTPTVWMFALQILNRTACTEAVRLLSDVKVTDGGYCQARKRIPLRVFQSLAKLVVRRLLDSMDHACERWRGHRVFLADGSSFSMPDTPDLQRGFGQPSGQAKGCGFPVANVVGLFHRPSGLLLELLVNPLYTSEMRVVRQLFRWLRRGDVLVGDRAYASYSLFVLLGQHGVDVVTRLHQSRRADFRRGRRIDKDDRIVELKKPRNRPPWMSLAEFVALPKSLTVRMIRYQVVANGYRTQTITLMTTLLDPGEYPVADVADLYGDRWEVETCYRHLKDTLRMDVLRCRSEDMIRRELLMHCIVYNLVRAVMVQAGLQQGVPPDRIGLLDVVRHLARSGWNLDELPVFVVNAKRNRHPYERAVKRRPKHYRLLTSPRRRQRRAVAELVS